MTGEVLQRLSLEEKVSLLAGASYWRTARLPEHEIKAIKVWFYTSRILSIASNCLTKSWRRRAMVQTAFGANLSMPPQRLLAFHVQHVSARRSTLNACYELAKQSARSAK